MKRILVVFVVMMFISSILYAESQTKKFVRFEYDETVAYGLVINDTEIQTIEGDIFGNYTLQDNKLNLADVKILPPTTPSKIIAVGLNYQSHSGMAGAGTPGLFSKLPSSLTAHDSPIWLYRDSTNLHYEGEMVLVIGKKAHQLSEADVDEVVFGVTVGNDLSERDWQMSDLQWIRAKGADSYSPAGPWIVTGLDYNNLRIQTRVNGLVRQNESTKNLIHNVNRIVSYISQYITLLPGDLIFTGTPGQTRALKAGDVIEVELEGVGILRNMVEMKPAD